VFFGCGSNCTKRSRSLARGKIGLFIVLPVLGAQLGIDLGVVCRALAVSTGAIINAIIHVTGKA